MKRLPFFLSHLSTSLLLGACLSGAGLLGLVTFSAGTAHAQSAAGWNKRGQAAESREDYDAAYEAYRKASQKSPHDIRYKTRYENMRFKASASHVDRGRVFLQGGDSGAALTEFSRALQIDPSNQTAQQEIDQIRNPQSAVPAGPGQGGKPSDAQKQIGAVSGIVELKPMSNDTVTLHAVEDTKVIYQTIGKAIGVNVLFDPDYTSKRIPIDLTAVTWQDALRIVATISGTFYKPVTSNTIFIAQNTRQKRTDLDEMAVQTFYLTNTATANDATEVLTAIRNLLDPSVKIFLVATQNAIVMRATPDQLLLAQKLLNDLDRSKPEVVVDVAVLEVNRDRIRTLGIQLPQSFGVAVQASNVNSTTNTSTTGTTTATNSTATNLTLNNLAHLNANNFAVTIGGAELDAMLTDSDTRILQNPRIRASDGQRATLKIGSKIPVATGSYSAGAATGLTAGIGVQTQFTYLDVGVNIDMTPTVHLDREVSLKLKVEVSSQNGSVTISGVTEPIISQRVAEQVIQLKDGEPSVLAGILTQQDSLSLSGTPGLGELPLIKYFFGSRKNEKQQDEIVFLLIPHIVRESVLSRLNTRAIDTGTSQSIELRRDTASIAAADNTDAEAGPSAIQPPVSAASAAAAMVHPTPHQLNSNLPSTLPQVTAPLGPGGSAVSPGGPITLAVQPASSTQAVGATFQTTVNIANAQDVFAIPLQVQFNSAVLQLVNVDTGTFLGSDGQAVAMAHRDEGNGLVALSARRPPNTKGVSGQGSVCTLTFKAIAAGDSNITLVKVGASNSALVNLPAVGSQAVVHVK